MYLYGSEHALMDYHLNPEKKEQVKEVVTPQTETKKDETDIVETNKP